MKSHTICTLVVLVASILAAVAAESLTVGPGTRNSYGVLQAPVLKVYTAKHGEHRFVAYVVKWKDSEVIVSDPLANSNYKVGDKISFSAQKITVENKESPSVSALVFTLGRPMEK